MAQYLVAIHHPDTYDASLEDEAMHREIDVLNDEGRWGPSLRWRPAAGKESEVATNAVRWEGAHH